MNDFEALKKRALEIRLRYEDFEKKKTGKVWNNKDLAMGFAVDVGELMEIIMAKEGARELADVDRKLAHELSDCLWCIFVLADKYDLDIKQEFLKTMGELDERLDKAGV